MKFLILMTVLSSFSLVSCSAFKTSETSSEEATESLTVADLDPLLIAPKNLNDVIPTGKKEAKKQLSAENKGSETIQEEAAFQ